MGRRPRHTASIEHGQFDQVVVRHRFHRLSGLAPGAQSARDYKHLESFFDQYLRHPGARGFARSSTVKINLPVFGETFDFFFDSIWLQPDRSGNALGFGVVVSMAPHICN